MKLIKAYIREFVSGKVIELLEEAGVSRLMAIDVRILGNKIDGNKISMEFEEPYEKMIKLEIICNSHDTEKYIQIIKKTATTEHKNNGFIAVSNVDSLFLI